MVTTYRVSYVGDVCGQVHRTDNSLQEVSHVVVCGIRRGADH